MTKAREFRSGTDSTGRPTFFIDDRRVSEKDFRLRKERSERARAQFRAEGEPGRFEIGILTSWRERERGSRDATRIVQVFRGQDRESVISKLRSQYDMGGNYVISAIAMLTAYTEDLDLEEEAYDGSADES